MNAATPIAGGAHPLRYDTPPAGPQMQRVRTHLPPLLIEDPRVLAAIGRIEADLAMPQPLAALAALGGLSPFHFHRLFVDAMGETVGGYARRLRMDLAAIHLLATPDSMQSIAALSGYGSLAAFNHAFRRQFGVAPTHYRELARQAVPQASAQDHALARRIRVENLPPQALIGLRFHGGYDSVESYWQIFAERLRKLGVAPEQAQPFGLAVDNPQITPDGLIRYHCAIPDPGLAGPLPAPWERHRLHGGRYASLHHEGPYQEIFAAYTAITLAWMPKHQERFSSHGPALECYAAPPWERAGGSQSMAVMIQLR